MLLLLRFSTLIKFFPLFFNSLLNLSSNSSGLTCFLALQRYDQTDNQNNILLRVGFSPSSEYFNSLYCDIIRFSDVFFFLFLFLLVRVHSRCRIPFSFVLSLLFFRAKFEKVLFLFRRTCLSPSLLFVLCLTLQQHWPKNDVLGNESKLISRTNKC